MDAEIGGHKQYKVVVGVEVASRSSSSSGRYAVAAVAVDVVLSIGRRKATGMPGLLCLLSSTHTRTSETPGNA